MRTPTKLLGFRLFVVGLTLAALSSCSRMGVGHKVGVILGTGGTAGALVAYRNQADAAAAAASMVGAGLVAGSTAFVIESVPATPDQIRLAEGRAREVIRKMPSKYRAKMKKKGVKHLAVETSKPKSFRGECAVVVYDVEKNKVAKPVVFDVRVKPDLGSKVTFDTYVSEFVGAGNDLRFMGAPE